jgi:GNAT superfamily N-acetyltransferase
VSEAPQASATASAPSRSSCAWEIRLAGPEDVAAVAVAVRALLLELGGTPGELGAMEDATSALIEGQAAGVVLVAEIDRELVGVLAASWLTAIHAPGAYALIQDLWVRPDWRSRAVGGELLDALLELARGLGFSRVEVGLPRESFVRFAATEAFYRGNGFAPNGPRMRRGLA